MAGSAIPDILMDPQAVKFFKEIQLPAYMLLLVGWAKLLGVLAILVPGNPRLKEWAYAGLTFDLLGAIYCIAASGKPASQWAPMIPFLLLPALAYVWYHKRLKAYALNKTDQRTTDNAAANGLHATIA
jgi:uncharacterized membrane protein YphA (DoxX/SURF4 family)